MNLVDSAIFDRLHPASIKTDETTRYQVTAVWVIGAWKLDTVCYLFFGAWNFVYSKTQLPRISILKPCASTLV